MRQSSLNLALVGAGAWMEKYHIPAIMSLSEKWNLRIRGIWNRTIEKAEACAATYGIPRVYESLEELTLDSETDCRVVVVSKTALAETLRVLTRRPIPLIS
ncbi:MAG: Gfo/Idh/MocA family oxidoreductase [Spirochaetota bacterium]